jgi:hypothetical protein
VFLLVNDFENRMTTEYLDKNAELRQIYPVDLVPDHENSDLLVDDSVRCFKKNYEVVIIVYLLATIPMITVFFFEKEDFLKYRFLKTLAVTTVIVTELPMYYVNDHSAELARCMVYFGCGMPLILSSGKSLLEVVLMCTVSIGAFLAHASRCALQKSFNGSQCFSILIIISFTSFVWWNIT